MNRANFRQVLDCASPLALWTMGMQWQCGGKSGGGPPHSKTASIFPAPTTPLLLLYSCPFVSICGFKFVLIRRQNIKSFNHHIVVRHVGQRVGAVKCRWIGPDAIKPHHGARGGFGNDLIIRDHPEQRPAAGVN